MKNSTLFLKALLLLIFPLFLACESAGGQEQETNNKEENNATENSIVDKIPSNDLPIRIYLSSSPESIKSEYNLKTAQLTLEEFEKLFGKSEDFLKNENFTFMPTDPQSFLNSADLFKNYQFFKFKTTADVTVVGILMPMSSQNAFFRALDKNNNPIGPIIQIEAGYNWRTGEGGINNEIIIEKNTIKEIRHGWELTADENGYNFSIDTPTEKNMKYYSIKPSGITNK